MSARRTYVLIVDQDGRANTEQLREWLQGGWSICSLESAPYGPSGLAVAITVEREIDGTATQKRWRAKKKGGGPGRGLPY